MDCAYLKSSSREIFTTKNTKYTKIKHFMVSKELLAFQALQAL